MAAETLEALPPEEAIRFFRDKGFRIGFDWREVWNEEHARAFTVAKAMRVDILNDIRGAVDQALADGTTFAVFRENLEPILQQKGWWGRSVEVDPLTGERREVQLGSPRRLKIIYDTNLRTAYAAGTWERIERVKERRPFLRYVAIQDERTRPEHLAWHDVVLPVDDPFWNTHYPPNGWRCRCTVQQMSRRDLNRLGLDETEPPPPIRSQPFRNQRTGEVTDVPNGIDPGFAFNVGKATANSGPQAGRVAEAFDLLSAKVDQAPADIARRVLNAQRTSRDFDSFAAGATPGAMPVAIVDGALSRRIGAGSQVVRFSQTTAAKQTRRHPELDTGDYERLQEMIDRGEAILDRDRNLMFHLSVDGALWRAVIKATRDGREIFLQTLHRIEERHLRRARRRGESVDREN